MGMCPSSSWQQSLNSLNKTRSACVRLRVWDWITSVERMWGRTALESAWVMRNGECTACTGTLWTPDSPGSPAPTANPRLGAAGSLSFLKTQTHHKYHQSLRSKWTIYLFFFFFFFYWKGYQFLFLQNDRHSHKAARKTSLRRHEEETRKGTSSSSGWHRVMRL